MNSDVPLWLQVSKTFAIPPGRRRFGQLVLDRDPTVSDSMVYVYRASGAGDVGSITLDSETLDRPSLYRVFYEKYEPTPVKLPADVAENNFSIKNLDTGTTVSAGAVNELVLRELNSTRSTRKTKHLSNSSRYVLALDLLVHLICWM